MPTWEESKRLRGYRRLGSRPKTRQGKRLTEKQQRLVHLLDRGAVIIERRGLIIDILIRYRDHEERLTPAQLAGLIKKDLIEIIPNGAAYVNFKGRVTYWQFRRQWLQDAPDWLRKRYERYLQSLQTTEDETKRTKSGQDE